ncbi:efflux RND transporter periplasmic adaptor subunit [Odoribacter sp. OttesenSCG-928-G04]|nr:efflux RND transporter periplasmic adaptor subunit [Odoribacter sp. OttesenSCG-928-G04]
MKKSVKRGLSIGVALLILSLILGFRFGWFSFKKEGGENTPQVRGNTVLPVEGMVARYTTSTNGIRVTGTLIANEEVELIAEIVGKVAGIYFEEGSGVKKGELLLKVDDADLQAQLTRAEFQHKLLSEKLERQRILLKRESVSREDFDQLQTDLNVLEADIELLNVKIGRTEIRAPFDGVMGFRYVSEGSYVQPNTRIASIVDNTTLKFDFAVPERHAYNDLKGREVVFTTFGSEKLHTANVYAVDPMIDINTRNILLRARFDNKNRELMPGMFAKGELKTENRVRYMAVPTEAVVPEMDGKRMWVLKGGKAQSVKVETESRDALNVEVVSGIQVGDTVLTSGLMQLRDGMKVNVSIRN